MVNQTRGLSAVAASTWGATFRHARQVYNSVVRPAVCFGATAWHSPSRAPEKPQGIAKKLGRIQNRCLRTVAGAYKATPIKALEVETHTPPIHIYLDRLVAGACLRLQGKEYKRVVRQACDRIKGRVHRANGPQRTSPGEAKEEW